MDSNNTDKVAKPKITKVLEFILNNNGSISLYKLTDKQYGLDVYLPRDENPSYEEGKNIEDMLIDALVSIPGYKDGIYGLCPEIDV